METVLTELKVFIKNFFFIGSDIDETVLWTHIMGR